MERIEQCILLLQLLMLHIDSLKKLEAKMSHSIMHQISPFSHQVGVTLNDIPSTRQLPSYLKYFSGIFAQLEELETTSVFLSVALHEYPLYTQNKYTNTREF